MLPSDTAVARARRRLLEAARAQRVAAERMLGWLAAQRLLVRLHAAGAADGWAVTGAWATMALLPQPHRRSDNLDLLALAARDDATVRGVLSAAAAVPAAGPAGDDGLLYAPERATFADVTLGPGHRVRQVRLPCALAEVRCVLDLRVHAPRGPRPELQALTVAPPPGAPEAPEDEAAWPAQPMRGPPAEWLVAEKVESLCAAAAAGEDDGRSVRWQDIDDLDAFAAGGTLGGAALLAALRKTFADRATRLPAALPPALQGRAAGTPVRRAGWAAYQRARGLTAPRRALRQAIALIEDLLELPLGRLAQNQGLALQWPPGGPWR